ncbi:MAG: hypothetical protein AABZ45_11600 [Pseudomonadota bacterium]
MAVISNTFGGLHLSGADATKFRNQTRARTKSEAARRSMDEGVVAAQEFLKNGRVVVA